MRVLVVDDSRATRFHLTMLMESLGAECVVAPDGEAAIEKVATEGPFDLALVDYNMPKLDGAGFLHVMRSHANAANMKKLMVTSLTDEEFIAAALENGADDYLMKPFTKDALIAKLRLLDFDLPTA